MAPTKDKRSNFEKQAALIAALQAEPGRRFRASELKRVTGVSKSAVRGLLTAVDGVRLSEGRPLEI